MNPKQAMMNCTYRSDLPNLAQSRRIISLFETIEKALQIDGIGRQVSPDRHFALA